MSINWTLVGQMVFFVIFVLFCMKFVWPPITQAMKTRVEKIADGLAAAERASHDLELAKERAASDLKDAKVQAAQIIEQAKKRGDQMVDEAKQKAQQEAERIRVAAEAEIEQQLASAKEQLRKQVAALAIAGAERVLAREVNAEIHGDILNQLSAEL